MTRESQGLDDEGYGLDDEDHGLDDGFTIIPCSSITIASPVATPTATISHLDVLPPTLVVDIDRDVRELYTRSGMVRDEIFSERYRFRSLVHEQERTAAAMQRELQEMKGRVAALEQERGRKEP
nr:hypothetical protein [Tanacetum cinerariifolium]